jgi:hypothetical protein
MTLQLRVLPGLLLLNIRPYANTIPQCSLDRIQLIPADRTEFVEARSWAEGRI